MLVIKFGRADLANVRFAISPLVELHRSVLALEEPSARALHLPWIREALPRVKPRHLELLRALQPRNVYTPDFIHPPPSSPIARLEDELEEMLATPPDRVRDEVLVAYPNGEVPAILRPFLDRPETALRKLAEVIRKYWAAVLEAHWPRLQAVLEGDVLYRARQMADGGASRLFADLHPEAWFDGDSLRIEKKWKDTLVLDGRGLLFVPSAFAWPKLAAITEGPWQPTLLYPARGVGSLWEPVEHASEEALVALLGQRRATVLSALDMPRSTTDLASDLGLSSASISQHLGVLRDAGLVRANRVKRVVLYARTPRGDSLLQTG
jgi:DNA-binding transcriptional ArsR family regulator